MAQFAQVKRDPSDRICRDKTVVETNQPKLGSYTMLMGLKSNPMSRTSAMVRIYQDHTRRPKAHTLN